MKKTNLWTSNNIANEIEDYIANKGHLKSRPPLTTELLKTFPGCEHYTQEEAEFKLKSYAVIIPILRDFTLSTKIISIDNQQVVTCCQDLQEFKNAA